MRVSSLSWLSIVTTVRTNGTIASMKQERDSRKAHGGILAPLLTPAHSFSAEGAPALANGSGAVCEFSSQTIPPPFLASFATQGA
jgi:hypothetical protein